MIKLDCQHIYYRAFSLQLQETIQQNEFVKSNNYHFIFSSKNNGTPPNITDLS